MSGAPWLAAATDGAIVRVKAVPGSSRDRIQGLLGDELKIAVAAPPERGKANARIEAVLAAALGTAPADVRVVSGHASAHKRVAVRGLDVAGIRARLGL